MSFILDALKKSEGQRQRQSGPALFDVKVAPPRTRIPVWAAAVGVLLLVNLGVLGWVALRPSSPTVMAPAQPVAATPAVASASTLLTSPVEPTTAAAAPPPLAAERRPTPVALDEAFEPELIDDESDGFPLRADESAAMFDRPAAPQSDAGSARVTRGTSLGIPTYDQLLARPGPALPDLRLDLHVFATDPAGRFIFLNNTRLGEGEALPNGTRVEDIVPDGAVLSVRGTRFLMQRQ